MLDSTHLDDAILPQDGPQTEFLTTNADIAIYGGAAGGGKTFGLLLEAARHIDNPLYGAVIFRREAVQITSEGGLLDTSFSIYNEIGGRVKLSPHYQWVFDSGANITFSHLHNRDDVNDWQGSQIPFIGYDELTHFTDWQFWYMLSRNRSMCGVQPYIRATCNPDADSWVAKLVDWYIDQDTGYPIKERSGFVRYFIRLDNRLHWANSRQELIKNFPGMLPKSFTFIPATLDDNVILTQSDPNYRANLLAMNRVERERLLHGNWKIRPATGSFFPRIKVETIDAIPTDVKQWVRKWDLAATVTSELNPSPDATAGVLMGLRANGRIVIADVINVRVNAHEVRTLIKNIASQDKTRNIGTSIVIPIDPGQAGKDQAASLVTYLMGYKVKAIRESGSKITRAEPFSSQWQAGNVDIVSGQWNDDYLTEMEIFPDGNHDDSVDASSGAFLELTGKVSDYNRRLALAS